MSKNRILRKRMSADLYAKYVRYQELCRIESQARKGKEAIRTELKEAFSHRDALLTPDGSRRIVKSVTLVEGHWVESYEKIVFSIEEIL